MDIQEETPSFDPVTMDMQAQIDALRATIISASGTSTGPQKTPFKPKPPIIGGIKDLTPVDFDAWTGGNTNHSGLQVTPPRTVGTSPPGNFSVAQSRIPRSPTSYKDDKKRRSEKA
jgi:hypothetical protein